jgi:RNA polymerase sigma-70 factor (ECF subfamily)
MWSNESWPQLLARILSEGKRAWPDVELDPAVLEKSLAGVDGELVPGSFEYAADLYLAQACVSGNPQALQHFESLCRLGMRLALRRMHIDEDEDDAVASVMTKLLVPPPGGEPKLRVYDGRTELKSWLQVILARHVLNAKRAHWREQPLEDAILSDTAFSANQEWQRMDRPAKEAFKSALRHALTTLSCRDRNLLCHRLDDLDINAIGLLYQVHPSTVWRRLARVSMTVEHAVRQELKGALRLGESDAGSLLRSLLDQLDSSICRQVSHACRRNEHS